MLYLTLVTDGYGFLTIQSPFSTTSFGTVSFCVPFSGPFSGGFLCGELPAIYWACTLPLAAGVNVVFVVLSMPRGVRSFSFFWFVPKCL